MPGVTYRDMLDGLKDPSRWLTYSGDYTGQRHSPLTQITPRQRRSASSREWTFQTGTMTRGRGFEATPLAVGRRALRDRLEQLRVGARRAHGPAVLAVSARPAGRSHLRRAGAGQPRLRHARRSAVHGHARRAPARARSRDRRASSGTSCSPTTRSATRRRWRRSWSTTR